MRWLRGLLVVWVRGAFHRIATDDDAEECSDLWSEPTYDGVEISNRIGESWEARSGPDPLTQTAAEPDCLSQICDMLGIECFRTSWKLGADSRGDLAESIEIRVNRIEFARV
jgi:hypothetical protein